MSTYGISIQRNGWSPRSEQFYNRLLVGLKTELTAHRDTLIVKIVADRGDERATFSQWAEDGSVDAVVCKDITVGDDLEDQLRELGLAYVVLADSTQQVSANAVMVDNGAGLREILDHLRAAGHRRIDWITGPTSQFHTHARMQVFADYLADGRIEGIAEAADYDIDRCRELVETALQRDRPPTAFLVDGDHLATVVLECARAAHRPVPDAVSVVSWDDTLRCQRATPPITALEHYVEDLGRGVARCLIATTEGRELHIPGPRPSLVVRESSA